MSDSLRAEQKKLVLKILENPADKEAKNAYSAWIHEYGNHKHGDDDKAAAIDYILGKIDKKPTNFSHGKENFESVIMQALGLKHGGKIDAGEFSVKIDVEALLKGEDFFSLKFEGKNEEVPEFIKLKDKIVSATSGDKVMRSLAAYHIADKDLYRVPSLTEHALYKIALNALEDTEYDSRYQEMVAARIYDKTVNPNFPEHSFAARLVHKFTGNYPDGYVEGYGDREWSEKNMPDSVVQDVDDFIKATHPKKTAVIDQIG